MINIRIIIGVIILAFGCLTWLGTLYENMPTDEPSPTIQVLNLDNTFKLIINSVIIGIGFMILIWGVRSSHSSNR